MRLVQGIPQVALVGYTNAGKSTLLNAFIDKYEENEEKREDRKVMAKNMLFATPGYYSPQDSFAGQEGVPSL